MYLLILESIGTAELIMIGFVALIIFGPRKLPEMLRSFGKTIAEFKRSTNEFKQSWEKEVDLDSIEKEVADKNLLKSDTENSIRQKTYPSGVEFTAPEIKEIKGEDFERLAAEAQTESQKSKEDEQILAAEISSADHKPNEDLNQKQDWL